MNVEEEERAEAVKLLAGKMARRSYFWGLFLGICIGGNLGGALSFNYMVKPTQALLNQAFGTVGKMETAMDEMQKAMDAMRTACK